MVRVTYSGDANFNASSATATQSVNQQPLTITGITAANKPYDGTTVATLNTSGRSLVGLVNGDNTVIISATGVGTFTDANAGTGKTVNITGLTLAGPAAANYSLTQPSATANIAPIAASVTPNAASKSYGAADPAFTGTLTGFLAADNVTATYTRTAGETAAGSPYAISATLGPAGLPGNYVITVNTAGFTINKATATVVLSGLTAAYTGSPVSAGVATTPSGLSTAVTYNGSSTAPTAPGSYTVIASVIDPNYTGSASGMLTINPGSTANTFATSPSGLMVSVDGVAQASPFTLYLTPARTPFPWPQAGAPGVQYVFSAWSDAGSVAHSVTVGVSAATYTATFTTQYLLTTAPSPRAGGSIAPGSGYYNAGSLVTVTAAANAGYSLAGFSGAITGTTSPQTISLGAPANVVANFTALAPQLAVSAGAASVSGANVTVPLTVTNSGLGAGTNVTVTGIAIVSFTGTGPVTVASTYRQYRNCWNIVQWFGPP